MSDGVLQDKGTEQAGSSPGRSISLKRGQAGEGALERAAQMEKGQNTEEMLGVVSKRQGPPRSPISQSPEARLT